MSVNMTLNFEGPFVKIILKPDARKKCLNLDIVTAKNNFEELSSAVELYLKIISDL